VGSPKNHRSTSAGARHAGRTGEGMPYVAHVLETVRRWGTIDAVELTDVSGLSSRFVRPLVSEMALDTPLANGSTGFIAADNRLQLVVPPLERRTLLRSCASFGAMASLVRPAPMRVKRR
jgi:hypothetical protein